MATAAQIDSTSERGSTKLAAAEHELSALRQQLTEEKAAFDKVRAALDAACRGLRDGEEIGVDLFRELETAQRMHTVKIADLTAEIAEAESALGKLAARSQELAEAEAHRHQAAEVEELERKHRAAAVRFEAARLELNAAVLEQQRTLNAWLQARARMGAR